MLALALYLVMLQPARVAEWPTAGTQDPPGATPGELRSLTADFP